MHLCIPIPIPALIFTKGRRLVLLHLSLLMVVNKKSALTKRVDGGELGN